jgi:acyl-CoA thioesterase FadM
MFDLVMEVYNLTISHASPGIDLSPTAGASLILAESNCRYLRPVMWPDTVTISTRTTAIGETSWTTEFQVVHTRALP